MCGIVGYVGTEPALPVLIQGMRQLEYRGYDSAGVAVAHGGAIETVRRAGHLGRLEEALQSAEFEGTLGIGHTRWATHGAPNDVNAHPHVDSTGKVALVHNGIVENFDVLKERL
ncbi:MAG: glutamine--fructose-6-phosphate aminotransferase, partial [Actinomycetota bacterium]|nr:glutamine--fructose-6-phosphate aminotransferase [Actinomycetota bacterium]